MAEVTLGLSGGQGMDHALRTIADKVARPTELRVGFLEGATYPDGTSVPLVAAVQEFGSRTIPPRPFFRQMIAKDGPAWGQDIAKLLPATSFNVQQTLGLMGERIVGQLRQSIRDLVSPPLAPATVRRKGFSKPLVDTGHMLNSADYEVNQT